MGTDLAVAVLAGVLSFLSWDRAAGVAAGQLPLLAALSRNERQGRLAEREDPARSFGGTGGHPSGWYHRADRVTPSRPLTAAARTRRAGVSGVGERR